jgi:hypothetical protein
MQNATRTLALWIDLVGAPNLDGYIAVSRNRAAVALPSSGARPAVDQRAFGELGGRYMRPAMAPPLTESTSPVT